MAVAVAVAVAALGSTGLFAAAVTLAVASGVPQALPPHTSELDQFPPAAGARQSPSLPTAEGTWAGRREVEDRVRRGCRGRDGCLHGRWWRRPRRRKVKEVAHSGRGRRYRLLSRRRRYIGGRKGAEPAKAAKTVRPSKGWRVLVRRRRRGGGLRIEETTAAEIRKGRARRTTTKKGRQGRRRRRRRRSAGRRRDRGCCSWRSRWRS